MGSLPKNILAIQLRVNYSSEDPVWNLVWNNIAPPKVAAFVWKAVHGRIQTRLEVSKRNIVSPQAALCPLCSLESESVVHFVCHCGVCWQIWTRWSLLLLVCTTSGKAIIRWLLKVTVNWWLVEVFKPLIQACVKVGEHLQWSISVVPRECNSLADNLAKQGISRAKDLVEFSVGGPGSSVFGGVLLSSLL
ncbi:hypothetical protein V6N13_049458 [Hibiscus sabdariffa]